MLCVYGLFCCVFFNFSLTIRFNVSPKHAENEKRLQQLHNKIDTEIANLKTVYEMYRNDVFKYAGGRFVEFSNSFYAFSGYCCS